MSGVAFDATFAAGVIVGGLAASSVWGLALWDTRRVTLGRLWRDWHRPSERRR